MAAQGCAGRGPTSPSTAAGCCQQGPRCLPLPQPCCCSCLAPIASTCPAEAHVLTQGTRCCRTPQTGCGPAVPHFLPGPVAVSPALAQAGVTRGVLSTRTFKTSADGLLCAHAQPRQWERDFVFLLAGLWSEPSSPHAKLVVAWEHVGWWQVQTGKRAEICCWRCRHDLASCSAAAPAEPRLCEEAGQSPSPCPRVHPRGAGTVWLLGLMQSLVSDQVPPSLSR